MSCKAKQTWTGLLSGLITRMIHRDIDHNLLFISCLPCMKARDSEFYSKTKGISAFICGFFHYIGSDCIRQRVRAHTLKQSEGFGRNYTIIYFLCGLKLPRTSEHM